MVTHAVLPDLVERKHDAIINIGSVVATAHGRWQHMTRREAARSPDHPPSAPLFFPAMRRPEEFKNIHLI
jgi:hypothetical protein